MPARWNLAPTLRSMANLAEDFFELRRRWFDRWLKGLANGIDEEPPVRVFAMGGGSGRRNRDGRLDHGGRWRIRRPRVRHRRHTGRASGARRGRCLRPRVSRLPERLTENELSDFSRL